MFAINKLTMANIINLDNWLAENKLGKGKQLFLTEKQVRSFSGFEEATDDEVQQIISSLHILSLITYELVTKELNHTMSSSKGQFEQGTYSTFESSCLSYTPSRLPA